MINETTITGIIIGTIVGVLSAIIIGIYTKTNPLNRLFFWFKSSTILTEFSKNDLKSYRSNFISNKIDIVNHNNLKLFETSFNQISEHHKILSKLILKGKLKHSFVVAPTGVGKTTFLVNLFLTLKKQSRASNSKKILLGKLHLADTELMINKLIKSGKSKKTILLLDGFDEFYEHEYNNSFQFWKAFNETWDSLRKDKLKFFPLVIIAVREQFLEYDSKGNNTPLTGITSRTLGGIYMNFIHLLPFNDEQIERYVKKRYAKSGNYNKIRNVISKINSSNPEILGVPLILDFLEFISVDKLPSVGLIKYEVYEAIVEGWIQREINQNKLKEINRKLLLEFCIDIAVETAFNTSNKYIIDKKLVQNFEFKSFISGLENRSMLKKVKMREAEKLAFTHNSFLEYFLVKYAIQNEENEKLIPFEKYTFARDLFIAKRWKDSKKIVPKTNNDTLEAYEDNIPDIIKISKWLAFFKSLSCNKYVEELLKNNLSKWLKKEDPNWYYVLSPMHNWWVTTDNFFPEYEENRIVYPNKETIELVDYLKELIYGVSLVTYNFKTLGDFESEVNQYFKCFSGISQLKVLNLGGLTKQLYEESYLTSTITDNFKESINSLEKIDFYYCSTNQETIEHFRGASQIKFLNLSVRTL